MAELELSSSSSDHFPSPYSSIMPRLPPELVTKLLNFARPPPSSFELTSEPLGDVTFKTLLCSASLTCHGWRELAQEILWERVIIWNDEQAEKLLQSKAFGRYLKFSLRIAGGRNNAARVGAIVEGLKGLKHLEFYGFIQLPFNILLSPTLKDLTSLHMNVIHMSDTILANHATLPFALRSFRFWLSHPLACDTPFSIFYTPFLTSLFIHPARNLSPHEIADVELLLYSSAPHLLECTIGELDEENNKRVLAVVPSFASLRMLHLSHQNSRMREILSLIPSRLTTLDFFTLRTITPLDISNVTAVLHLPSLTQLSVVSLPNISKEEFIICDGASLMLSLLKLKRANMAFCA